MINNLVQFLRTQLPTINFVANGWTTGSDQSSILVMQSGGDPDHYYERTDWRAQLMARDKNSNAAKIQIETVYDLLKNRFHLLLPAVTVNKILYPAIQTYQISPIQSPGFVGADDANLLMWSFNITVTTT